MKLSHPELYDELKSYYGLDPLKWFENDDQPIKEAGAE
jgi:Mlc titration factor MtfA (ptsG expression regulator)